MLEIAKKNVKRMQKTFLEIPKKNCKKVLKISEFFFLKGVICCSYPVYAIRAAYPAYQKKFTNF